MVKSFLITLTFLFFCSISLFAQHVTILASVDSSDYLIGDYINYTIEVRTPDELQIQIPAVADSIKKLELIKLNEPVQLKDGSTNITRFSYVFSFYDSSEITIPEVPVKYKSKTDSVYKSSLTNPVTFTVHTVKVNHQEDIKDVKEPITIPFDWKFWIVFALIFLVLLAISLYFYRRYKLKKLQQPVIKKVVKIPIHVTALAQLDNLENEKLWQNGKVKEYHSRITEIVRDYFAKRFELPALELTTSESLQQLEQVYEARNVVQITNEFLNNADLVKFAKYVPMDSINQEMMKQAREIIQKTIPFNREKPLEVVENV
jgi:hypothetical protein